MNAKNPYRPRVFIALAAAALMLIVVICSVLGLSGVFSDRLIAAMKLFGTAAIFLLALNAALALLGVCRHGGLKQNDSGTKYGDRG